MAIVTIGFNPAIDRILECPGFHIGGHQQARLLARLASGKAANVSRALALLSTDSIATGFVGAADLNFFHNQLMSAGPGRILCRFVEVGGKTRENITLLDPQSHIETHIRDRGFTVTPEEMTLLEKKIAHELKPADLAIFSGSLCADLPEDFFSRLIDQCLHQQALVAIDSSGTPLRMAAAKPLWLLKPNLEELRELLGKPIANVTADIIAATKPLLANIEHLLISRGREGAILITRQGAWAAKSSTPLPAVRTVMCGDYLLAGFAAERIIGREPRMALVSALTLATARALSPKLDEIEPHLLRAAAETVQVQDL